MLVLVHANANIDRIERNAHTMNLYMLTNDVLHIFFISLLFCLPSWSIQNTSIDIKCVHAFAPYTNTYGRGCAFISLLTHNQPTQADWAERSKIFFGLARIRMGSVFRLLLALFRSIMLLLAPSRSFSPKTVCEVFFFVGRYLRRGRIIGCKAFILHT